MTHDDTELKTTKKKRIPLWQGLIIILIIIAMPLFFSFARDTQLQQTINQEAPSVSDAQHSQ
jgi:hypothetical protein